MSRREIGLLTGTVLLLAAAVAAERWWDGDGRAPASPGPGEQPASVSAGSGPEGTPAPPPSAAPTPVPLADTGAFVETFDGAPAAPEPFSSARWDIQVHERGMVKHEPGWLASMHAQHGPGCEGPDVTHEVATTEAAVFRCRDHVMTALFGPEYGVIYLTPDHMVDWSAGSAVIEFSVSTERLSKRDWIDIWISPWDANMALPFNDTTPDLQGPPEQYLHIAMDSGHPESAPRLVIGDGDARQGFGGGPALNQGIPESVNQSAARQPFRLTLTPTSARLERLESETAPAVVYWEHSFEALPFSTGVVQFGHHSYNPMKDDSGVPATWHWDGIRIEPAIPFRIETVEPRYVQVSSRDGEASGVVTFPPAAPDAYLRFSATMGVKVNGELVAAQVEPTNSALAQSYFVPIPEGSTSATIEFEPLGKYNCSHGCLAKDFAVWSLR